MTATRTAAADLVTILTDEGVSHLFVNPGMHTAPLREALDGAAIEGIPHPEPVPCVHEHVALSAAHGHHLAGGGPEAVMIHVEGGPLNVSSAVENLKRARVPVVVFSAESEAVARGAANGQPAEAHPLSAGRNDAQGGIHGGKWDTSVPSGAELGRHVRRAFQIARADPAGLTHLSLRREALREAAGKPSRRLLPPRPPAPDPAALEEMAELLAAAEAPLIIAGRVGRQLSSVPCLARLAETLAAPVADFRNYVNLPPQHPLNLGLEARDFLPRADAILLLDVEMPCLPGLGTLPAQAWLLQIDLDCLKATMPGWAYPMEIALTADTGPALAHLDSLLADRLTGRRRQIQERRAKIENAVQAARQAWRARATSDDPAMLPDAMLAELNQALPEDALVLEELAANSEAALRQIERPPGQFFRRTESKPGWSIAAALGARLARPNQPVVALCDDDAFNFGLPTAAYWSAHRVGAPFLTVVFNRRGYRGPRPATRPTRPTRPSRRTAVDQAGSNGSAGSATLEPESDVMAVARACGAEAEIVERPRDVAGAVERLLACTRDGVCGVLDVRLPR
jgi:acetolactate synthase I/II/III large subunit